MKIIGRPRKVSLEQVRAFLQAAVVVMSYHSRPPRPFYVHIKALHSMHGWWFRSGKIELERDLDVEDMLTTCVHEVIHASLQFPHVTEEKCTSTLTARIKPDVARIAQVLLDNTYRRAAYIAHCRLSYRVKSGADYYDQDQYCHLGLRTKYRKRKG